MRTQQLPPGTSIVCCKVAYLRVVRTARKCTCSKANPSLSVVIQKESQPHYPTFHFNSPPAKMSTPKPLEIKNVQGDILYVLQVSTVTWLTETRSGLPKKVETYWFIQIQKDQVDQFRTALGQLVPLITTTSDVLRCRWEIGHHKKHGDKKGHLLKLSGVNVAFSQKGLTIVSRIFPKSISAQK